MESIFKQAELVTALPADALAKGRRNYNAALIDFDGRLLLAYRHEPECGGLTSIRIAELSEDHEVTSDAPVIILDDHLLKPRAGPPHDGFNGRSWEDPRLFVFQGQLHLAWTAANYLPKKGWTCRQCYGKLETTPNGWSVKKAFAPKYGDNDGRKKEKNWQFFEAREGTLCAVYSIHPHVVLEIQKDKVIKEHRGGDVRWPNGSPCGGTPPVKIPSGEWLTIFHAHEHDPTYSRRYHLAALTFDIDPPFRPKRISIKPLIIASEEDPLPDEDLEKWRPLCVFPQGLIQDEDSFLISLGVNDCRIALLDLTEADLQLSPMDIPVGKFVTVRVLKSVLHEGKIIQEGSTVTMTRKSAVELERRGRVRPVTP